MSVLSLQRTPALPPISDTTRTHRVYSEESTHSTANRAEPTEPRGFALYVGIDEVTAAQNGISLPQLVAHLKNAAAELVPDIQTHATLAIAARDSGGRNIDVVRYALNDPAALHAQKINSQQQRRKAGVTIDFARQHVQVDGRVVSFTAKEFQLLGHLVENEGETVHRNDLLAELWDGTDETPNERTVDVHVRRLRAKLGEYQEIVRTIRGIGYRFDRHPDVTINVA